MLGWARFTAAVLTSLLLIVGCGGPAANEGDCVIKIRYEGVLYRPHSDMNQSAPVGDALGVAEAVGCGDVESARKPDEVGVSSIEGIGPEIAIAVVRGLYSGRYVAVDLPMSDWPTVLNPE